MKRCGFAYDIVTGPHEFEEHYNIHGPIDILYHVPYWTVVGVASYIGIEVGVSRGIHI